MAHVVKLASLTNELITVLTGFSAKVDFILLFSYRYSNCSLLLMS